MYARMLEAYMVQPGITLATTARLNWVSYKFIFKTKYISLAVVKVCSKMLVYFFKEGIDHF